MFCLYFKIINLYYMVYPFFERTLILFLHQLLTESVSSLQCFGITNLICHRYASRIFNPAWNSHNCLSKVWLMENERQGKWIVTTFYENNIGTVLYRENLEMWKFAPRKFKNVPRIAIRGALIRTLNYLQGSIGCISICQEYILTNKFFSYYLHVDKFIKKS